MQKRMKIENDPALYLYVYCKINKENKKKTCAIFKKMKTLLNLIMRDIFQVKKLSPIKIIT